MRRATTTLLLALIAMTMTAPNATARQFKKPVYYPTNDNVWGIATGDFNHDGKPDLAFAEFVTGSLGILLGNGDGSFEAPRYFHAPGAVALAVGDFDDDHKLDLAVVENGGTGLSALGIFLGDGQGNFNNSATYMLGVGARSLAVADFDGDGHLDIAVSNALGYGNHGERSAVLVLFGNGDGTFRNPDEYAVGGYVSAIAAGDFNRDHHPDLAVAQSHGRSVAIFMNKGNGKFKHTKTYPSENEAVYVAVADLDHNGTLDLVVCNLGADDIAVLLGKGNGTFGKTALYSTSALGEGPWAVAIADFNGDGNVDIAIVLNDGKPGLFYGNGDGTFQAVLQIKSEHYSSYALAVGDFNRDGEPDLAVGAVPARIAVLINAR